MVSHFTAFAARTVPLTQQCFTRKGPRTGASPGHSVASDFGPSNLSWRPVEGDLALEPTRLLDLGFANGKRASGVAGTCEALESFYVHALPCPYALVGTPIRNDAPLIPRAGRPSSARSTLLGRPQTMEDEERQRVPTTVYGERCLRGRLKPLHLDMYVKVCHTNHDAGQMGAEALRPRLACTFNQARHTRGALSRFRCDALAVLDISSCSHVRRHC